MDTRLAGMDHPQLLSELQAAAKELGIKDFNPGVGRHSGASIDRASQKQGIGRWASLSRVRWYEEEGCLSDSSANLTPQQQGYCTACELQDKDALLHGRVPGQAMDLTRGGLTNGRN